MEAEKKTELKLDRDTLPYLLAARVVDECGLVSEEKEPGKRVVHYVGLTGSILSLMIELREMIDKVIDSEVERKITLRKEYKGNENDKDTQRENSNKVEG